MERLNQPANWLLRSGQVLRARRWILIGMLWIFAFALGYAGFSKHALAAKSDLTRADVFYLTIQLFVLESGSVVGPKSWELEVARLLAPTVAAYTAIQALALLFVEQFQFLRLRAARQHVIICGLGRRGLLLARSFREHGHPVVVIEQDAANEAIKVCRQQGTVVLIGDATNAELLEQAGLQHAHYLIAVCDDDGANAEIAVQAQQLSTRSTGPPLTCLVHLIQPQLCELLHGRSLDTGNHPTFRLDFFNTFDLGAKILLEKYPPLSATHAQAPHILILGFGSLGQSLAIQAARARYCSPEPPAARLQITVVDREADRKVKLVNLRYPCLPQACDLIPCTLDTRWPEFQQADFLRDQAGQVSVTVIYICFDDDALGLTAALTLAAHVRDHDQDIPIIVRTTTRGGLASLFCYDETARSYGNIHAFPLLEYSCAPDLVLGGTHETVARALHQRYVQQQVDQGQTATTNPSLVPWDELPADLQEGNRTQADAISTMLKSAGYRLAPLTNWDAYRFRFPEDVIEKMARLEHERFVSERLRAGWSLGPKDTAQKSNPNLVAWEHLTADAQERTRHPLRELPCILAEAGLQIYQKPARASRDEGKLPSPR